MKHTSPVRKNSAGYFFYAAILIIIFSFSNYISFKSTHFLTENMLYGIIRTSFPIYRTDASLIMSFSPFLQKEEKANTEVSAAKPDIIKEEIISDSHVSADPVRSIYSAPASVTNDTGKSFDFEKIAKTDISSLKGKAVLVCHTHTSESYTPSENYPYSQYEPYRTLDKNFNVVRVGFEVTDVLKKHDIEVFHDTTVNDYPSYNGSYGKSALGVANYIKNNPEISIVLDIHRDAVSDKNGEAVKHLCNISGKDAASIMLVVGSNISGLKHDAWQKNMAFAINLQKYINSVYPGLCRSINLRKQRFNQQLAPGAVIVEVGTNGNTLDEAIDGAHYFAECLAEFLK